MDTAYNYENIKQLIIDKKLTLKNFIRFHKQIYNIAKKSNILNELIPYCSPNRKISSHTKEDILNEAKKYESRFQFQLQSKNLYRAAVINNLLDEACSHMLPVRFSIPQMICKDILDNLLRLNGIYNDCNIIYPMELDIYYPSINLGIEYDGNIHHDKNNPKYKDNVSRDEIKNNTCKERNIHLLRIKQIRNNNNNYKNIEEDIKNQIIEKLDFINLLLTHVITPNDVISQTVDINKFYSLYNIDNIQKLSQKYKTITDFSKNHKGLYNMLIKIKRLDILDHLRTFKPISWIDKSDEEIAAYITSHYSSYEDARKDARIYTIIYKRKIVNLVREAFDKK